MHPSTGNRRGSLGADATAAGSLAASAADSAFNLYDALRWFDKALRGCAAFAYTLVLTLYATTARCSPAPASAGCSRFPLSADGSRAPEMAERPRSGHGRRRWRRGGEVREPENREK